MSNELSTMEDTSGDGDLTAALGIGQSPALMIMLNDKLFDRAKLMAKYLAGAAGFCPPHLVGKTEACFAVVSRALIWKLDPFAVAQCTYQTPGGQVGFMGKLCQAVLENSGKISGPVKFEHYGRVKVLNGEKIARFLKSTDPLVDAIRNGTLEGWQIVEEKDWSAVQGKFEIKQGQPKDGKAGKDYAHRTWQRGDAQGLGVTVSCQIKGEVARRTFDFDLEQAFPLNSTLWATDPKTQICYTAVRRFCSLAVSSIFMGVPFDYEDQPEAMRDVTPEPSETRKPAAPSRSQYRSDAKAPIDIETSATQVDASATETNNAETPAEESFDEETGEIAEGDVATAGTAADIPPLHDHIGETKHDGDIQSMADWVIELSNLIYQAGEHMGQPELDQLIDNNKVVLLNEELISAEQHAAVNDAVKEAMARIQVRAAQKSSKATKADPSHGRNAEPKTGGGKAGGGQSGLPL